MDLLHRPISNADRARACWHLLDWLGCAALGARSPVGQKLMNLLASTGQAGPCATLFEVPKDWQSALWLNAAVGNVEEMDDVHRTSILHPGPVVIPAAIAAAQRHGASAEQLLNAIIIGYEAMICIGRALGPDHYAFYHNTASCGSFGSAAAVASILGLEDEAIVSALGNAGSRTGGLWQMRHEAVDTKQFHNVDAALTGSLAAYMAQVGVRGPAMILEGPQGLFAATSPKANPEKVTAEPQSPWLMWACSFKPWPACRHVHASIDACRAALAQASIQVGNQIDVARIDSVLVETYNDALVFCDKPQPQTPLHAKFSLQHAVAVCLLYGRPSLEHFQEKVFAAPSLASLREKIEVVATENFQSLYPEKFGARVSISFDNGEVFQASIGDAWGDPENPLNETDLIAKARTLLSAAGMDAADVEALISATMNLWQASGILAWTQAWPKPSKYQVS